MTKLKEVIILSTLSSRRSLSYRNQSIDLQTGFYMIGTSVMKELKNLYLLARNFQNHFVGNKVKGRISKRVFQESKACQNFRKTNISYPLIRPFALLPTISSLLYCSVSEAYSEPCQTSKMEHFAKTISAKRSILET